jgi:hypothetical protein
MSNQKSNTMNLTEREFKVLQEIILSDYQDCDDEGTINNPVWLSIIAETLSRLENISGKTFSGLCSSLLEKELIGTQPKDDYIWVTSKGYYSWEHESTKTTQ